MMSNFKWMVIGTFKTRTRANALAAKVSGAVVAKIRHKSGIRFQVRRFDGKDRGVR